jgi:hypothetical protein
MLRGDAVRIYFDNCCLNRPYDDLKTNQERMECEAVLSIIDICEAGDWLYFNSDVLLDEILETADNDKRERVMLLYRSAAEHIGFTETIFARAKELEAFNIQWYGWRRCYMIGNPSVIRNEGYRVLTRELGAAGAVVFLRQFESGSGNYTEDRRAVMDENTVDRIADRIRKRNENQTRQA